MATTIKSKRVGDIMTQEPVCADESTTIRQLALIFEDNEISGVPVVNDDGRLVGVVSKTDLIRRCSEGSPDQPPGYLFELLADESGEDTELIPEPLIVVGDFMTTEPLTARPSESVSVVARRMVDRRVHRVIIVDRENHPVGVVTSMDLLNALAEPDGHA